MKLIFLYVFLASAVISNTYAQSNVKQDAITGTWLVQDGSAKIKIENVNGKYAGKIVWLNPPLDKTGKPFLDKNNPDKNLQSHTLMRSEEHTSELQSLRHL